MIRALFVVVAAGAADAHECDPRSDQEMYVLAAYEAARTTTKWPAHFDYAELVCSADEHCAVTCEPYESWYDEDNPWTAFRTACGANAKPLTPATTAQIADVVRGKRKHVDGAPGVVAVRWDGDAKCVAKSLAKDGADEGDVFIVDGAMASLPVKAVPFTWSVSWGDGCNTTPFSNGAARASLLPRIGYPPPPQRAYEDNVGPTYWKDAVARYGGNPPSADALYDADVALLAWITGDSAREKSARADMVKHGGAPKDHAIEHVVAGALRTPPCPGHAP